MRLGKRWSRLAGVLLAALVLSISVMPQGNTPSRQGGVSYAASEQHFAYPEFEENWTRADGPVSSGDVARSWLWGPTPGIIVRELFAQAQDGVRTVQYFDKARMELNENTVDGDLQWRVTTGLLVTEMVTGRIQTGEKESLESARPRRS